MIQGKSALVKGTRMKTTSSLRWVGWPVLASAISMILSITFNTLAVSNGSITPGTRSHSVLVETFDVLTTVFLIPLPFALYLIYIDRLWNDIHFGFRPV